MAGSLSLTPRAGTGPGRPVVPDGWAFCVVAVLGALASLALRGSADLALDWQPSLAWHEPWRWWSAGIVHYSHLHLLANLAGVALVGALGFVTRVPTRIAIGWLLAWALTHLMLLAEPRLLHYGGLSGVLHAGVAIVAVAAMLQADSRAERWLGAAIWAGVAVKVAMEAPWAGPVQARAGWDIAIAPAAHLTGLVAGTLMGLLVELPAQLRMRRTKAVVE